MITPFGSTREYFGDRVDYARPDRLGEIAGAIVAGLVAGPRSSSGGIRRFELSLARRGAANGGGV